MPDNSTLFRCQLLTHELTPVCGIAYAYKCGAYASTPTTIKEYYEKTKTTTSPIGLIFFPLVITMNAKKEFLEFVEETNLQLKCGTFEKITYSWEDRRQKIECEIVNLAVNYTQEELDTFLSKLDFEDTSNLQTSGEETRLQIGCNTIWFADGTWGSYQFDAVNWMSYWVRHTVPPIPETLKR